MGGSERRVVWIMDGERALRVDAVIDADFNADITCRALGVEADEVARYPVGTWWLTELDAYEAALARDRVTYERLDAAHRIVSRRLNGLMDRCAVLRREKAGF